MRGPLLTFLQMKTRSLHQELDKLPFLEALWSTQSPEQWYYTFLQGQAHLHHFMAQALNDATPLLKRLPEIWHPFHRAGPGDDLQKELEQFAHWVPPGTLEKGPSLPPLSGQGPRSEAELLGWIYVAEGSRMGSLAIKRALRKQGLTYFEQQEQSSLQTLFLDFSGPRYIKSWDHFEHICAWYEKESDLLDETFLEAAAAGAAQMFSLAAQIFDVFPSQPFRFSEGERHP